MTTPIPLALRPGFPSDQPQLLDLKRRASLAVPEDREALLARPEVIDLPRHTLTAETAVVAMWEGEVAGFLTLSLVDDETVEIEALFVAPEYWRQGVGHHLMGAAERLALGRGATRIVVVSGGFALPFYSRNGFSRVGEATTLLGPAHRLGKDLDPGSAG